MLVGIVVFTAACAWRMNNLYESGHTRRRQDLGSINQAVWNSSRGHILHATILRVGTRDHLEPILIVYALNYLVGGTIRSLMVVHAFLIALGAVPLYLLARRRGLGVAETLLFPMAYFLLPPLHQMMKSAWLRPELLFFPALVLMAYAIVFSHRRCLIVSVVLALFCKEAGAFTVLGLGIYLMVFERRWRLGAALAILGALWVPMVSFVLLPAVSGMKVGHMSRIRPCGMDILRRLWGKRWPPIVAALIPCLLILKRWAAVIPLPHMVGLLFFKTRLRYIMPIIPIPWFLAMDVLAEWRWARSRRVVLILLPLVMIATNICLGYWEPMEPDPVIAAAGPLMAMIPEGAAVCTNNRLLVHLSGRARIYEFNRKHRPKHDGQDYLGADYFLLSREKVTRPPFKRHDTLAEARAEIDTLGVALVAEAHPWQLYRRKAHDETEPEDDE